MVLPSFTRVDIIETNNLKRIPPSQGTLQTSVWNTNI